MQKRKIFFSFVLSALLSILLYIVLHEAGHCIPVSRPIKKVGMTATIGRALLRFMRSKKHMAF